MPTNNLVIAKATDHDIRSRHEFNFINSDKYKNKVQQLKNIDMEKFKTPQKCIEQLEMNQYKDDLGQQLKNNPAFIQLKEAALVNKGCTKLSNKSVKESKRNNRKPVIAHQFVIEQINKRVVTFCGIQSGYVIYFGHAIRIPSDEPSELGETISYGKALCSNKSILMTSSFTFPSYKKINKYLLKELIREYINHFKDNLDEYMKFNPEITEIEKLDNSKRIRKLENEIKKLKS